MPAARAAPASPPQTFVERCRALEDRRQGISDEFKIFLADLRSYLETAAAFLDAEERALDVLDRFTREEMLAAYLEEVAPRMIQRLNAASDALVGLVKGLNEQEHATHRRYYREQVAAFMLRSPLLGRAAGKPLGHAGDYEMMNMIYRDQAEGDSLFARAVNRYALQERCAQAVRSRLVYIGATIRATVEERGRTRIASIGCGPAHELLLLLQQHPALGPHLDVALIDQDERALAFCERTLAPLAHATGARIRFIRESVRRLVAARQPDEALGPQDLIYSAGLFDYLSARSFSALLGRLYRALAPGGKLLVGNVGTGNPTRTFMEYCLDWFLIHRSREELRGFARELQPEPSRVEVDAEPLGVNLFLCVSRSRARTTTDRTT